MRLSFLSKGDRKRGTSKSVETLWRNPETVTLAQTVDAAVKMRMSLSAPLEFCWELMGWSQQKIMQAKKMMNLPDSPADAIPPQGIMPNTLGYNSGVQQAQAANRSRLVLPTSASRASISRGA